MTNPVRTCIGCTQTDDHPRHVEATVGGDVNWHLDCHTVATGCPSCTAQLPGVGGVQGIPKGDALREHLLTTGPEADKPGWTAPDVEA